MGVFNPVVALLDDIFGGGGGGGGAAARAIAPAPADEAPAEKPARAASPPATAAPSKSAAGANADGTSRDMGNIGASGNTMLTGPAGVDPNELKLGKSTLLGA